MTITEAVESIAATFPGISRSKIKRAFSSALKQGRSIPAARELVALAAHGGLLDSRTRTIQSFQPTEHEAQLRHDEHVTAEHGLLPGARIKTQDDTSRTVAKQAAAGVYDNNVPCKENTDAYHPDYRSAGGFGLRRPADHHRER